MTKRIAMCLALLSSGSFAPAHAVAPGAQVTSLRDARVL
jgi:hypothetical protein